MKIKEKNKAILLRKEGFSLNEISKKLNVSKSSVSKWVNNVNINKNKLQRLKNNSYSNELIEKRRQTRLSSERQKRQSIILDAKNTIQNMDTYQLKIFGTSMYWAEGSKTNRSLVRISNSDPDIIKIMMKYFRNTCKVKESKFRLYIHTHSKHNILEAEKFWSEVTKIPKKQFFKTHVAKSSASKNIRKTLPYGTCEIYVCDTELFLKITGWIEGFKCQS